MTFTAATLPEKTSIRVTVQSALFSGGLGTIVAEFSGEERLDLLNKDTTDRAVCQIVERAVLDAVDQITRNQAKS